MPSDSVAPSVAGYPIGDAIGPCPGGTAFRTARPLLGTPAVFRRLTADWLFPFDTPAAYLERATAAVGVSDPHLVAVLAAGLDRAEPFAVVEPTDGTDLNSLVADIGPMPALLAAEYARQAAAGLAAAHAVGLTHGDVRPDHLAVGPLVPLGKPRADGTPRFRPAPTAVVKVAEFGLVPARAKAADWPAEWAAAAAYLPPERFESSDVTPAGDVYQLGATLYFLLTGRPPRPGALARVRPDAPADVVALIDATLSADPAARPTMRQVAARLELLIPAARPPAPANPLADSATVSLGPAADASVADPAPDPAPDPIGWAAHPAVSGTTTMAPPRVPVADPTWLEPAAPPSTESVETPFPPRPRPARGVSRRAIYLGVAAFVLMNLLAAAIWFFVFVKM